MGWSGPFPSWRPPSSGVAPPVQMAIRSGPRCCFAIGMLLLVILLIKGILTPRTWWFAYTERELIVEHGLVIKARDHVAFDRVQYIERRAGPLMRPRALASLILDTAAGRATIPAAEMSDIEALEEYLRVAMQRAAVV